MVLVRCLGADGAWGWEVVIPSRLHSTDSYQTFDARVALGQTAADHFNRDVKKGVQFLQSVGLLSEPVRAEEMAWFLRNSIGLDLRVIGDYLGERDDFNQAVLHK